MNVGILLLGSGKNVRTFSRSSRAWWSMGGSKEVLVVRGPSVMIDAVIGLASRLLASPLHESKT